MQWKMQAGNLTTDQKVKIDFTLPEFGATKIVVWYCYVDNSSKIRYNMILGRVILTELRLVSIFSDRVIEGGDKPFERCTFLMVYLVTHALKNRYR